MLLRNSQINTFGFINDLKLRPLENLRDLTSLFIFQICHREYLLNNTVIQRIDIRLLAVGFSLLTSLFIATGSTLPNDDAYRYIRTAEIALSEGLSAAIENYAWAGYSLLIALVSQIGLDLFTAAYLINACFYGLLVYSFINNPCFCF